MMLKDWKEKYTSYLTKHGVPKMPDHGYGISGYMDSLAGHYTAFFEKKAFAINAAQYLANATRENVDLIAIQDHGNLRHIIGEVSPDLFSKFQT
jgi:hypothetical protein